MMLKDLVENLVHTVRKELQELALELSRHWFGLPILAGCYDVHYLLKCYLFVKCSAGDC